MCSQPNIIISRNDELLMSNQPLSKQLQSLLIQLQPEEREKISKLSKIYNLDKEQMKELVLQYVKEPLRKTQQPVAKDRTNLESMATPTVSVNQLKENQSISDCDEFRKIVVGLLQRVTYYKGECTRMHSLNEQLAGENRELKKMMSECQKLQTKKIYNSKDKQKTIRTQFLETKSSNPSLHDTEKWVTAKFSCNQTSRNHQKKHEQKPNSTIQGVHLSLLERIKNQLHATHVRRLSAGTTDHTSSHPKPSLLTQQKNSTIKQSLAKNPAIKPSSRTQSRRSSLTSIIQKMRTEPQSSVSTFSNVFLDLN